MRPTYTRVQNAKVIVSLILASALSFVSQGHAQSVDETTAKLQKQLAGCTAETGYDSHKLGAIGEHELAANERTYLACAYARIREFIIPKSAAPDAYRALISEYEQMTDEVEKGKLTRTTRNARALELLDNIAGKEKAAQTARLQALQTKDLSPPPGQIKQHNVQSDLDRFTNESVRQMLTLPPPTFR